MASAEAVGVNSDLTTWYRAARGFLKEHAPAVLGQIDDDIARLERLQRTDHKFYVCVLGQSAVGKSTMLNSIVAGDRTILPAGGIGPLTALATEVHYSSEPFFTIRYRSRRQLDGYRLQFEAAARRSDGAAEPETHTPGHADAYLEMVDNESVPSETTESDLVRQLTQLVKGQQFSRPLSPLEIVASLRRILALKDDSDIQFDREDLVRIDAAREALARAKGEDEVTYARSGCENFDELLQIHVAGNLAPLVETIKVGYPADFLREGIVLIDLPGIGVASDRYRSITAQYVKMDARAVILVVDRAGPTESSVTLLRESGYWARLLLSSEDPQSDPCALVIAVTKIDDLAREKYLQFKDLPKANRPRLADLFEEVREQVASAMYSQAQQCFSRIGDAPAVGADFSEASSQASATLLNSLRVFPISATEYRYLLADDEDIRPFIRDVGESGVPALISYISSMAGSFRDRYLAVERDVNDRVGRTVLGALDDIETSWTTKKHAREEAAKLRAELDRFLQPFKAQLENRRGEFREFLQSTAMAQVGELVAKSQREAQSAVEAYLQNLRTLHWATLRATVSRGGAHISSLGRRLDLAADIAQRFEEPLSAIWGRTLLKAIRARTREHGELLADYVGQICSWANGRSETDVQREVLDRQQQLMRDRAKQLAAVGREAADELKTAIKRDLQTTIEKPVRTACEDFRQRGDNAGPGVKKRILDLFTELARDAVDAAGEPASRLLKQRVDEVQMEVVKALNDWGDPIEQTADAVVEREEQRMQRSDSQRKAVVLSEVAELRQGLPPNFQPALQ